MADSKVLPLTTTLRRMLTLAEASAPGRPRHVASASGLVRVGDGLWVAPDDELHLARFDLRNDGKPGELVRTFPGRLPGDRRARKAAKPDIEAIVHLAIPAPAGGPGGALLALPSGSRANRVQGALVPLDLSGRAGGPAIRIDCSSLYAALPMIRLNIEGAVVAGTYLRLFHRGNSVGETDAVVDLELATVLETLRRGATLEASSLRFVARYDLGELDGVRLTFTDAAAVTPGTSDVVLFSAAAEATDDAYEDAPCAGSVVGLLRGLPGRQGVVEDLRRLDRLVKVEGVQVLGRRAQRLELGLVTDADDPMQPAVLLTALF